MTKKQISKMLVAEGFLYLGGAFMIAVLLVVVGAKQILINTLGTAFFLPATSYDSALCAYDSNFGWDCVCDTKVSVWKDESGKCCWKNSQGIETRYQLGVWICWSMRLFFKEIIIPYHVTLLYLFSIGLKWFIQSYCAYVLHVLLLWFHCFLSYNMDTGGGLDEIQDFSCRWW